MIDDDWDERLSRAPEATYFHTRAWAKLVTSSFPHCRDVSHRWIDPESRQEHLVPLFEWRRLPLLATRHSSFPFLYGGAIPAADPGGAPVLPRLARALARGDRSVRITGNPFEQLVLSAATIEASEPEMEQAGYRIRFDTTHVRTLPESESAFWEDELTPARRNDVRRIAKKGVLIEETRALKDADAVYRLYLASFARWGGRPSFVHPQRFYRALASDPAIRFTVARHEGRILGGTFAVRWNSKVHYLAGYFDPEARSLRPNVLLQIESIRSAIAGGYRWYDFLPSGGIAAVEEFKEGFGGSPLSFPILQRRGRLHRLADRLRSLRSRAD
jgi:hypothetical protein